MALVFSAGFETGDGSEFTSVNTAGTAPTYGTTLPDRGRYSANTGTRSVGFVKTITATNTVIARARFRHDRTTNPATDQLDYNHLLVFSGATEVARIVADFLANGTINLRLQNRIVPAQVGATFTGLAYGTWYTIDLRVVISATVGVVEMRVDNLVRATSSVLNTGTANIDSVEFRACPDTTFVPGGGIGYIDNVKIDDANYNFGEPTLTALQLRDKHYPLLHNGINVPGWFHPDLSSVPYLTEHDYRFMQQVGIRHIRLSLDDSIMYTTSRTDRVDQAVLTKVDAAVNQMLDYGFSVNVDCHRWLTFTTSEFTTWWTTIAGHFAAIDSERIFFEVLNEPTWPSFDTPQRAAVVAIRAVAPRNTILVAGEWWYALNNQDLVPDDNVVHIKHYYYPLPFTHQGQFWGTPRPCNVDLVPATNAADSAASAQEVINWKAANNRLVTVNEYGVTNLCFAAEVLADRLVWLKQGTDAYRGVAALCLWEYDQSFGLVNRTSIGSVPVPVAGVLIALGLKPPGSCVSRGRGRR